MKKREFIKVTTIAAAGAALLPLACTGEKSTESNKASATAKPTVFTLPNLPYAADALAPNIDTRTMEIHHGKHHAGYVRKLNKALESATAFQGKDIDQLMASIKPTDTALRNNGGGHYNHTLFWESMTPKATKPQGDLAAAITSAFGDFDTFKDKFSAAAKGQFGSGWAWLGLDKNNKLAVTSTANQDNPLMVNIVKEKLQPILGLDVWEHAYYLNYQNRRGDYVSNFFNVINWDKVAERFLAASK